MTFGWRHDTNIRAMLVLWLGYVKGSKKSDGALEVQAFEIGCRGYIVAEKIPAPRAKINGDSDSILHELKHGRIERSVLENGFQRYIQRE